ncbi:conserved hypothetical protein [Ricinus communis]|uniref:GRF-type domain-containing protein n=1 Tax=Ricinus communis TaxID=3988 RepID=B9SZB1_RICCO|nr:conserved hypothetical protein [Ricinus communis]
MHAYLLTSIRDDNSARRFYQCYVRKYDDCNFFQWCDPELPPFHKACFVKFKVQKEKLEEQ